MNTIKFQKSKNRSSAINQKIIGFGSILFSAKNVFSFFIVLCLNKVLYAQSDRLSQLGGSTRSLALGKANVSSYVQLGDVLSNPALQTNQGTKYAVSYMHHTAFKGLTTADVLVFGVSPDSSKVKLALLAYQLNTANIFDTRNLLTANGEYDFSQLTQLSSKDYGIKWVMAKQFSSKIALGTALNLDRLAIGGFAYSNAVGLDVGANYALDSSFSIGVTLKNTLGKYYFWNQNSVLLQNVYLSTNNYLQLRNVKVQLPELQLGVFKSFGLGAFLKNNLSGQLSVGLGNTPYRYLGGKNISFDFGFGYEAILKEKIYLRAGYTDFQYKNLSQKAISGQLALGFGIKINKVMLDFTISNLNKSVISSFKQLVSLQYNFEKKSKNSVSTVPVRF